MIRNKFPLFLILLSLTGTSCLTEKASDRTMTHNSEEKKLNRLANAKSLYLREHADNPVDWYPWGEEAFEKAKQENKPILVSIGYSSCHWCHVMEEESFMDTAVARFMNENFVCIKIDREEHPEVDAYYMKAVQMLSGRGGWPLNVFCTPEGDPFYGGTYFPPEPRLGMPSWLNVLQAISNAWKTKEDELREQARKLKEAILREEEFIAQDIILKPSDEDIKPLLEQATEGILKQYDSKYGGFGSQPKFPVFPVLDFLLRYGTLTENHELILASLNSLDKMLQGGIYDHLEGGLARYSTDRHWHIPHFEKMLYDNAQLIGILADAYKITGDSTYLRYLLHTLDFLRNWMLDKQTGGFYSAIDADSEGEEGKYYVWTWQEWEEILGEDAQLLADYFGVTKGGNWENGKNVLYINSTVEELSKKYGIPEQIVKKKIQEGIRKLTAHRRKRVKPRIDNKVLLAWNSLLLSNLAKASPIIEVPEMHRLYEFLTNEFIHKEGGSFKIFKVYYPTGVEGEATSSDLALLINSLISYYNATGKEDALLLANSLTQFAISEFYNQSRRLFTVGRKNSDKPYHKQVELYDHPFPSPNSMMAYNLRIMHSYMLEPQYATVYEQVIGRMIKTASQYPIDYTFWLTASIPLAFPLKEIVLTVKEPFLRQINSHYLPNATVGLAYPNTQIPLCKGKHSKELKIYVCESGVCHNPVSSIEEALKELDSSN